jgi:uncharacterized protein
MTSEVVLNVAQLLAHDPIDYEVRGEGLFTPSDELLKVNGLKLAEPLKWELIVRNAGGDDDFILEGSVSGVALLECRRCLDEVQVVSSAEFYYPMIYQASRKPLTLIEADDEDDVLLFGHPEIDFTELVTQLFAIDLPLTVLCQEDCKGLSASGVNLNRHPEAADDAPADEPASPFEALKDFEV